MCDLCENCKSRLFSVSLDIRCSVRVKCLFSRSFGVFDGFEVSAIVKHIETSCFDWYGSASVE